MTDLELLMRSAKAIGRTDLWFEGHIGEVGEWNPLTNDADALRMAVDLGHEISVELFPKGFGSTNVTTNEGVIFSEVHGNDAHAATRRAIVKAAAGWGGEL